MPQGPAGRGRALRATLLGLVAFGLAPLAHGDEGLAPAARVEVHPEFHNFQPGGRKLEVDGKPVPTARVYEQWKQVGPQARLYASLVTGFPGYGSVLVTNIGSSVYRVRPEDVLSRPDGGKDLEARAKETTNGVAPLGKAAIERTTNVVHFQLPAVAGGAAMNCALKPPTILLGWRTMSEVLANNASFGRDAMTWAVGGPEWDRLLSLSGRYELHMYFGTWCVQCEEYMGRVMAITSTRLEAARKAGQTKLEIQIKFYGLPPVQANEGFAKDPEVLKHGIQKLPAGLLYQEGRPIGRIEGTHWERPEVALYALLSQHNR